MAAIGEAPASLKAIQPYLKTAQEHDSREPIVSYWCRLYALQLGLKISTKQQDEQMFLLSIMDWLESTKKANRENESISNEVAAQAYLENYALKLFMLADTQDRASNFGKNLVKIFFTTGIIYDCLLCFGELTEEVQQNRKYAKWKAAYIHNCLKNGETPIPGPMQNQGEDDEGIGGDRPFDGPGPSSYTQPSNPPPFMGFQPIQPVDPTTPHDDDPFKNVKPPSPPKMEMEPPGGFLPYHPPPEPAYVAPSSGITLTPEQMTKAQKYCKWAGSALNYDDVKTAIDNLQKGLRLLQTGQDG